MSSCCSNLPCPWEQVIRSGEFGGETTDECHFDEDEDEDEVETDQTRMDIALLKEQYNWIKEKQRRETRVVLFKKAASNNEEISGISLINVVPMCQEVKHCVEKQHSPIQEIQFDFVGDQDRAPWRTHLGIHRMTCTANVFTMPPCHTDHAITTHDSTMPATLTDCPMESTDCSDKLSMESEESNGNHSLRSRGQEGMGSVNSRKLSAPAEFSRQLSVGGYQRPPLISGPHHYPFPQRKCPKKSEAARRLGMYSSF